MNKPNAGTGGLAARTLKNTKRLAFWTGAWLVTLAASVFGPTFFWESRSLSVLAILLNIAVGAGMIVANKRHLDGLDELQRKIQLEAMALALGVALVAGLAYSTADIVDAIAVDAEISYLVFLVTAFYAIGVFVGRRRYQ